MRVDPVLREVLGQLRRAYPRGVPQDDYMPLPAALADDIGERNVAAVVVANGVAVARPPRGPGPAARARVRSELEPAGWRPDPSHHQAPPRTLNVEGTRRASFEIHLSRTALPPVPR